MSAFAVFAILVLFVLPLVLGSIALLTEHQRKLAKIRQEAGGSNGAQVATLQEQVRELTVLVHQQTIALDGIAERMPAPTERIEQRIGR